MQQTYEALCCEVTHLHSELKHQAGLIRRLRPLISETRQGETHTKSTLWSVSLLVCILLQIVFCVRQYTWVPTSTFHTSSVHSASCISQVATDIQMSYVYTSIKINGNSAQEILFYLSIYCSNQWAYFIILYVSICFIFSIFFHKMHEHFV